MKISLAYSTARYPLSDDDSPLFAYQRLLVTALRQEIKRKGKVIGWNGVRHRIFVRVYRGRGKKVDHRRFLTVEKIVHRLAGLSVDRLKALVKQNIKKNTPSLP